MESQAFELVRNGSLSEARVLLFSDEYDKQKQIYARGMTSFAKQRESYFRLEELRGIIVHLDEVLTMSTRVMAVTADPMWERLYRSSEPQLDAAIEEATRLAPESYSGESAAETDAANVILVKMEHQAFDLIHSGRLQEAKHCYSDTSTKTKK